MAAPTRQIIDLQKQAANLLSQLQTSNNKAAREYLYQLLQGVSQLLNLPVPPLASLHHTPEPAPEPALAQEFWLNLQKLALAGKDLNHSRNPHMLGINLNEYQKACEAQQLPLHHKTRLMQALKASPRFIGASITVNSMLKDMAVKCWLFSSSGALTTGGEV